MSGGDPVLAAMNRELKVKAPLERVRETDMLLTACNTEKLDGERIVVLACGHLAVAPVTKQRMRCPSCQRMIDEGYDYDAFRRGLIPDPLPSEGER